MHGGGEASPVVLEADPGHGDAHSDEGGTNGELDVVVERLAERPVSLVAVGVDGDLCDELVEVEIRVVEVLEPIGQEPSLWSSGIACLTARRRRFVGMSNPRVAYAGSRLVCMRSRTPMRLST